MSKYLQNFKLLPLKKKLRVLILWLKTPQKPNKRSPTMSITKCNRKSTDLFPWISIYIVHIFTFQHNLIAQNAHYNNVFINSCSIKTHYASHPLKTSTPAIISPTTAKHMTTFSNRTYNQTHNNYILTLLFLLKKNFILLSSKTICVFFSSHAPQKFKCIYIHIHR